MSATRESDICPPKARPRPDWVPDTPLSEAFLQLPLEERRRQIEEVGRLFRRIFAGETSDSLISEKRRDADNEN